MLSSSLFPNHHHHSLTDDNDKDDQSPSLIRSFSFSENRQGLFEQLFHFQDELLKNSHASMVNESLVQESKQQLDHLIDQVSSVHQIQREQWIEEYEATTVNQTREKRQKSRAMAEMYQDEMKQVYKNWLLERMNELQYDSENWKRLLQPKYDRRMLDELFELQLRERRQEKNIHFSEVDLQRIETFEKNWISDELLLTNKNDENVNEQKQKRIDLYLKMIKWIERKREYDLDVEQEQMRKQSEQTVWNVFEFRLRLLKWRLNKHNLNELQTLKNECNRMATSVIEQYYSDYETFLSVPELNLVLSNLRFNILDNEEKKRISKVVALIEFNRMPEILSLWKIIRSCNSALNSEQIQWVDANMKLCAIEYMNMDSIQCTNIFVFVYLLQTMKQLAFWNELDAEKRSVYLFIELGIQTVITIADIDWIAELEKQCFTYDISDTLKIYLDDILGTSNREPLIPMDPSFESLSNIIGVSLSNNAFLNHLQVVHAYHSLKQLLCPLSSSIDFQLDETYDVEIDLIVRTLVISLTVALKQLKKTSKAYLSNVIQKITLLSHVIEQDIACTHQKRMNSRACIRIIQFVMSLWTIIATRCKELFSLDSTVVRYMRMIEHVIAEITDHIDTRIEALNLLTYS